MGRLAPRDLDHEVAQRPRVRDRDPREQLAHLVHVRLVPGGAGRVGEAGRPRAQAAALGRRERNEPRVVHRVLRRRRHAGRRDGREQVRPWKASTRASGTGGRIAPRVRHAGPDDGVEPGVEILEETLRLVRSRGAARTATCAAARPPEASPTAARPARSPGRPPRSRPRRRAASAPPPSWGRRSLHRRDRRRLDGDRRRDLRDRTRDRPGLLRGVVSEIGVTSICGVPPPPRSAAPRCGAPPRRTCSRGAPSFRRSRAAPASPRARRPRRPRGIPITVRRPTSLGRVGRSACARREAERPGPTASPASACPSAAAERRPGSRGTPWERADQRLTPGPPAPPRARRRARARRDRPVRPRAPRARRTRHRTPPPPPLRAARRASCLGTAHTWRLLPGRRPAPLVVCHDIANRDADQGGDAAPR